MQSKGVDGLFTHVIFDLDGTLLNTLDDLADAGNHVCSAHGWPVHPVEAYKLMVGGGIPNLVKKFSPDGLSEEELSSVLAEFSVYYGQHKEDKTAPYKGITEVVDLLKASGIHVAVLTNKADHLASAVIEHYFPGMFEAVLGSLPGVPVKPDPAMLDMLMDKIGAVPESTLFVGDSNVDIITGRNGGLTTCGVLWGFRTRDELEREGAHYIIDYPEQLVQIVFGTELLSNCDHRRAAQLLKNGGLVAVPTETVYGLASDATSETSVKNNYEAKGRPETKPLNVLVDGMGMVEQVCRDIPDAAYALAQAFWPGPLTMILFGNGTLPPIVPAGGKTQGVRCPDHADTLEIIRTLGRPLACPSANLSGMPSPKSAANVLQQLGGRIDAVLDGGICSVGIESTILDLTVTPFRILRQGGLSKGGIESVLGLEVDG